MQLTTVVGHGLNAIHFKGRELPFVGYGKT